MRIMNHDLDEDFQKTISEQFSDVIWADGKYAPCQGCFDCWTRHPATCGMKDSLHQICRVIGQAEDLGVSFILLAGGEPLLRRGVIEAAGSSAVCSILMNI